MGQWFEIKEIEPEKLEEALALVWKVFLEFEAPEYSREGSDEFKRFIEAPSIRRKLQDEQLKMWICCDGNKIIGVLAARPVCHISLLFVDGAYHRQGVARSLLEKMRESYQEDENCKEITVNSSPYAVRIYHKLGFGNTDEEQLVNGIRFVPMKRLL